MKILKEKIEHKDIKKGDLILACYNSKVLKYNIKEVYIALKSFSLGQNIDGFMLNSCHKIENFRIFRLANIADEFYRLSLVKEND